MKNPFLHVLVVLTTLYPLSAFADPTSDFRNCLDHSVAFAQATRPSVQAFATLIKTACNREETALMDSSLIDMPDAKEFNTKMRAVSESYIANEWQRTLVFYTDWYRLTGG